MRTTTSSALDRLPDPVREFLTRRIAEATGIGLIGATICIGLTLATWSVQDPSVNHAVDGPVRNLFGPPGAVVADILMQMAGVGALAFLAPLALWGWRLVSHRSLDQIGRRIGFALLGALAATALASLLPVTDRWPMPTGLGGVIGDAAARLAHGASLNRRFGAPAMLARRSSAFGGRVRNRRAFRQRQHCGSATSTISTKIEPACACRVRRREPPSEEEEYRRQSRLSGNGCALGAIIHAALSVKARWSRASLDAFRRDARPQEP